MSAMPNAKIRQELEIELGPQLGFYRRRREMDIFRDRGYHPVRYFGLVLFSMFVGALMLSVPLVLVAGKMGAVPPLWREPFWGPIIAGWYGACVLAIWWLTCMLPQRAYLAIHEDGFAIQGLYRRRLFQYRDIASCEVINSTATVKIDLHDRTTVTWRNFLYLFPLPAVEQLLNLIAAHHSDARAKQPRNDFLRISQVDLGFKRRIYWSGIAVGFILVMIMVLGTCMRSRKRGS